ncbi:MAG TPA: glycoside hydrolase family 57 protein [Bryobacteraceae bacterium]|nr:glycoside hydrolase family 57 protein [Bryobacteraceae bacterium]
MAEIYVCFVWHMHQPFYKDLVSGEYKLPWTRLHALKDYYGMVKVLEDFPAVHQTFNLVPSLLVQIDEYASGQAADEFLRMALCPAERLDELQRAFILQYFFQANPARMIYRYPRYGELFDLWRGGSQRSFDVQSLRDLQVLSQLAWFDEEWLAHDSEIRGLVEKGRGFNLDDQSLLGRKQTEKIARVLPMYRDLAGRGQIEISTTPFYHPILPLICDSNIAEVSHPYVPLPSRFEYPQDARYQVEKASEYIRSAMNVTPAGLWPSEGAVSDDVLALAATLGFRWIATDNGVLGRSIQKDADAAATYRPYVWRQEEREIKVIFRDHYLSDLIGFVYSRMGAAEAAAHFLTRIRENCRGILASGRDALVPIILDGENAWEYYQESGRPFLRELYRRITDDPTTHALTVSEALARVPAQPISKIFPGSWINANFDVWIGAEEDNTAWEHLLRARQTFERVIQSPEAAFIPGERKQLAHDELMIAEGSDWCWWYGPEHDSANRPEFDRLFRDHLANVYLALKLSPPEDLSRPILKIAITEHHQPPSGPVKAVIDGEVTSYFEWLGAGMYRVDSRSGAMHGKRFLVEELRYGSDGNSLFLRLDFIDGISHNLEIRINLEPGGKSVRLRPADQQAGVECKFGAVCEVKLSFATFEIPTGGNLRFQLSLWQQGLPVDALPPQGWIEFSTAEPVDWII